MERKGGRGKVSLSPALERLVEVREVARFLAFSTDWVYDAAAKGVLPSYKVGGARRFRLSEIEAWLAEQRKEGW